MTTFPFLAEINNLPEARDFERARRGLDRWRAKARKTSHSTASEVSQAIADDSVGRALLGALFGNSPFLGQSILLDPTILCRLAQDGSMACLKRVLNHLKNGLDPDITSLMRRLRVARREVAVIVGVSDIANLWSIEQVTSALTQFAEEALRRAVSHLLSAAAASGDLHLPDRDTPQIGSGFVVLGLGKLGGGELNYSSDIDLIVVYDPNIAKYSGREDVQLCCARLARSLAQVMQDRTDDGYVFRTDFRLRPDSGASPLALSVQAAEAYYESMGQSWERAALIKARPVAGDLEVGDHLLADLAPFIWRKHIDFAAIQDIHAIKQQIDSHRGGGAIAVHGHNIKLGRGGIREIEFFAQTQQLVWGGRDPSLRCPATCDALRALALAGRINDATVTSLIDAYGFLRRIEHRLQMIDDAQTHSLPVNPDEVEGLAVFLGYQRPAEFPGQLLKNLQIVERHYARLFEDAPSVQPGGNIVFTGAHDEPETLANLRNIGFDDVKAVAKVVRGWYSGRFRATNSTASRQILSQLLPALLDAFAKTARPDSALMRFNNFIAGLPACTQLFSMFRACPPLLDLIAELMGSAPRLSEHLRRRPQLMENVLESDFYQPLPNADALETDVQESLEGAADFASVLDHTRRWARDREFQLGMQILSRRLEADAAGAHWSDIAEAVLRNLLRHAEQTIALTHGRVPQAGVAIIALGKLGGREMTSSSDLDMILVYKCAGGKDVSDGSSPLPASQYFLRLSQKLISGLTKLTSEGQLFKVDMRLRPSGSKGPLASEFGGFLDYHGKSAWTWEHMALTRARVVAGPIELKTLVERGIREILSLRRDQDKLATAVAEMRVRIDEEHRTNDPWNVKYVEGGLVDIEFIVQFLQLGHACDHPEILNQNLITSLTRIAKAGLVSSADAGLMIGATRLMQRVQSILRLTIGESRFGDTAPEGLRRVLARAGESADFQAVYAKLLTTQGQIRELFKKLVRDPTNMSDSLTPRRRRQTDSDRSR